LKGGELLKKVLVLVIAFLLFAGSLSAAERWVFYADKIADAGLIASIGPAALLVPPEEGASGEISVSNYGVSTRLRFPSRIRRAHFALYSFYQTPNALALRWFKEDIDDTELKRMRKISWWSKESAR